MITSNVIYRTFFLLLGEVTGTCFSIDVEGRQYIVTAKHVLESVADISRARIYHDGQWKNLGCKLVGICEDGSDVAVLSLDGLISPSHPLSPSSKGLVYGQDVYFLGFPYGWNADIGDANRNFPLPFVKKAVVSNMPKREDGKCFFFLDGHNNPGFSGGPVVFKPQGSNEFKVAAVISGYKYTEEPVFQNGMPVPLAYKYNTGIIVAYDILHAINIIENNPVGLPTNP